MISHRNKALPKDLGGWQNIINTPIQDGDLEVWSQDNLRFVDWVHDSLVGTHTNGNGMVGNHHIYRKMACPQQGEPAYTYEDIGLDPKAKTDDEGKAPLAWLPWKGLKVVAAVQSYGHRKYGEFSNYKKGMEESRNISCALRHIAAYMEGESNDPESNESHLAHAVCRLLFVLENQADGVAIDDRFKQP